jgi:hypothetical protein
MDIVKGVVETDLINRSAVYTTTATGNGPGFRMPRMLEVCFTGQMATLL